MQTMQINKDVPGVVSRPILVVSIVFMILLILQGIVNRDILWYTLSFVYADIRFNPITISCLVLGGVGLRAMLCSDWLFRSRFYAGHLVTCFWVFVGYMLLIGLWRHNPPKLFADDVCALLVLGLMFVKFESIAWWYFDRILVALSPFVVTLSLLYILLNDYEDRGAYYFSHARYVFELLFFWGYFWFTWRIRNNYVRVLTLLMLILSLCAAVISETRGAMILWLITTAFGWRNFHDINYKLLLFVILCIAVGGLLMSQLVSPVWSHLQISKDRFGQSTKSELLTMTGRTDEFLAYWKQASWLESLVGRGAGGNWDRTVLYDPAKNDDIAANWNEPDLHSAYGTMVLKGGICLLAIYTIMIAAAAVRGLRSNDLVLRSLGYMLIIRLIDWIPNGPPWGYWSADIFWVVALNVLLTRTNATMSIFARRQLKTNTGTH